MTFKRSSQGPPVPHDQIPSGSLQSQEALWQAAPVALMALECLKVLVPRKEAVMRPPSRAGEERSTGYSASRVGEFKESDDWSPLLLLLR